MDQDRPRAGRADADSLGPSPGSGRLSPEDADRLAPEAISGVRILPVLHDRIEMAPVVRAVLDALDPRAVAVELPTTLAAEARRAAARLPKISVILSHHPGEPVSLWTAAPGDPFCEALRWAGARDRPSHCIDPDIPYLEQHGDALPDPYAVWSLGPVAYLDAVREACAALPPSPADKRREDGMAFHLRQVAERSAGSVPVSGPGPVLALVGAAHATRLAARLGEPAAIPFARPRRATVDLRHLHPDSLTAVLPDPPLAHGAWETQRQALERGEPLAPERAEDTSPADSAHARPVSLYREGLHLLSGLPAPVEEPLAERLVASAARRACRQTDWGPPAPDRAALGRLLWSAARKAYREQTQQSAAPWQSRTFLDFSRRYARIHGQLEAGLYEWVVAARGVADDNLSWELYEAARAYPWQEELAEITTVRLDGDHLELGTRRLRFRRRFPSSRAGGRPLPLGQRPRREPAKWLAGFDTDDLCSYPPEDLRIEGYGDQLRGRAMGVLRAERSRVEPFTGSLLDGIDLRETLRRRLQGGPEAEIWVRERGRVAGRAGAVVVIFDRDLEDEAYPHLMTWHGEHHQESDMAFYSTDPAEQVVGPGILKAVYGGFLLVDPPGRLASVWDDPEYTGAQEKAEVLIMAAIDYSLDSIVVHLGRRPPNERMRRHAALRGRRLVHLPLGSLAQGSLHRIRTLHILAGKDKREIAKDYIR